MATTALAPPIRLPFQQFLTERTPRRRATPPCAPKASCIRRRGRHLSPIYTPARAPKAPGLPARAPLAPIRRVKDGAPVPGEKSTFPFTKLPTKMKKDAPLGRKAHLITRHPPRTIKNRPPIQAKNAAPLCRTAVIKNKKTGRPIWTSCKFGCGNNLTSRGVIPKYFRRRRA